MSKLEEAIAKIESQQSKEHDAVWGVGEQLKDIIIDSPELAELVLADLDVPAMSLAMCEKKIKERADSLNKNRWRCVCVCPAEAEDIIRKFYGLPPKVYRGRPEPAPKEDPTEVVDLESFF